MNISQKGINLIKSYEGLMLHAYKPLPTERYYTIGYGHYGADVSKTDTITASEAEELLKKDVAKYADGVTKLVKVAINQNQFDALCSFSYNLGIGALATSSLLKFLNAGNFIQASKEFDAWVHAGGHLLQGLVKRRNEEQALFNTPVPKPVVPPAYPGFVLKKGMHGEVVKTLQKGLKITADGDFGSGTEAKVKAFQSAHKLVADGIVGKVTWNILF
jgi:GH24 family phage-related lysozyme (muramidase)